MRRPLFRYIFLWSLAMAVCLSAAATMLFYGDVEEFYYRTERQGLFRAAALAKPSVDSLFCQGDTEGLRRFAQESEAIAGVRLTVVDSSGKVLADSSRDPSQMENHAARPEIRSALAGGSGASIRFSRTLGTMMLYVAVPLDCNSSGGSEQTIGRGVLRLAMPLNALEERLQSYRGKVVTGVALVLILAIGAAYMASRVLSRPLQELEVRAQRLADGDFDTKFDLEQGALTYEEILSLQDSLTHMAQQLKKRFQELERQKGQLELIFSSMKEAVMVLDQEGRVKSVNRSAQHLLDLDPEHCIGRPIKSVVRNMDLQRHIDQVLTKGQDLEEEIAFSTSATPEAKRYLYVRSVILRQTDSGTSGLLVVIDDLTRLRRLESLRQDFVSNVSHELKTPITSIKGYVETLLEGAMHEQEIAKEFLSTISRQADRLEAIVEDLLLLSRIERDRQASVQHAGWEECDLCLLVEQAVEGCSPSAVEKGMRIHVECDETARVKGNPRLLEQAISNLIINAVKYSPEGSCIVVTVSRRQTPSEYECSEVVEVTVKDEGPGIPKEHQERIFERFYRIDKARSRKMGGTGLGLAIVKHVVQLHGGSVRLESAPGKGSTFTMIVPAA